MSSVLPVAGLAFLMVGCGETTETQQLHLESSASAFSVETPAPVLAEEVDSESVPEAALAVVEDPGRDVPVGRVPEPWSLESVRSALEREPDVIIGVLDEPSCQMFGSIRDVAVDQNGRVFVLDRLNQSVRAFGLDGECLFEFGREGSGPGEFRQPESLDISQDGRIRVLDSRNARIEQYDMSGPYPQLLDAVPLSVVGIDLCTIGSRLFVAARSAEFLLYEIDSNGGVVRGSGALEAGQYMPVHAPEMALCRQPERTIILASRHSPRVRWYDAGGDLLRQRDLPEFAEARIIERDGRAIGYGPGPDGLEQPASFLPLAGGAALLQTGLPRDASALMYMFLKTYMISLDGRVTERLDGTWPHIFAAQDSVLVAGYHDVVPRIGIWRKAPGP